MRLFKRRLSKRTVVVIGVMAALLVGGVLSAAWASNYCQNEPFPDDVGREVVPGVLWVGVDTGTNNNPPFGAFQVCVNNTTLSAGTTLAASPATGIYASSRLCENATCSGVLGETGAETRLVLCNATTGGNCAQNTKVKAAGSTLVNLERKTGVDDNTTFPVVTQGTTPAQNIACVGTTCVRSVKVSAGRVDVYANSDSPTPVNLCVTVGPGMACP